MDFISNSLQRKRVVRSWARRRVQQAVTEALKIRGFEKNGRRLVGPDSSTNKSELDSSPVGLTVQNTPETLIGTVSVHILQDCIKASFNEVQRQAEVMADKIVDICGRYPHHI